MSAGAPAASPSQHDKMMFWGCFVALITTSFAFTGRMFLIGTWEDQFGLSKAQAGALAGIGIWPFAVSIILFSLVIDKIGYKTAMFFAFIGHLAWTIMAIAAYYTKDPTAAYNLLYWGSLVCALANGTVESFINPVVATMFNKEKTKWLNILHAGWPAGLVITGLLLIGIETFAKDTAWSVKIGLIGIPTVIYFLMLVGLKFPQSERVEAGVSYKEMLKEFGVAGAAIVAFLLVLQLMEFFNPQTTQAKLGFVGLGVALVVAFGAYTQSFGRPLLIFLILIMMPLATTEIGTDGWITSIMEGIAKTEGFHAGWILVYTSAIMLVLRFMAGPIVHAFSPLGLLAFSAILAIAGLTYLSTAVGTSIFVAATLYGFGKTFFWPTMLGVVSEQCPKGGALTLNAISGIGMLAVGVLGFPYIGILQTKSEQAAIVANTEFNQQIPGLVEDGKVVPVVEKKAYQVLTFNEIDKEKVNEMIAALPADSQEKVKGELKEIGEKSTQGALASMAYFPMFMLACYVILIIYFKSKGGYKQQELHGTPQDEKFTGGVEAAVR